MEISIPLLFFLFCFSLCIIKLYFSGHGMGKYNKRPPGPKPWPIVGNILQLTDKPHRALADLSRSYGPLMWLKLGSVDTLVVSSADMAREVIVKHDLAFSDRKVSEVLRAINHNLHSMAWLPVSPQWRNLRKLVVVRLFSKKRLDANQPLHHKKVCELREYIGECCRNSQVVDIGRVAFTTSLNLLSNTFFSIDMLDYRGASSHELKGIISSIAECAGTPYLADFFPVLSHFDPQGLNLKRKLTNLFSKLFELFDDMIRQRLSTNPSDFCSNNDVLATLLQISKQDGSYLNLVDIKHLLINFFAAGTLKTSNTPEWAMTELLRHPSKMAKAQEEIDGVLGKDATIQESDIQSLPYLQAIVKETFRLHPPLPLLLPHKAQEDVELCSYHIPNNTQMLINLWAIGRDLKSWERPTEFLPERFLERGDIDTKGVSFELIPFGAGRRICPGMPMADRMLHVMLATLVHGFCWRLPNGMGREEVDMNEKLRVALQKANPLLAIPIPK